MSSHSVFHHFQTLEFCRRDVYFYKEFQDTGTKCDVTYKRRFTIANSYYFRISYKKRQFSNFLHIFHFSLLRGRGPLLEAWRTTFGPRVTGWEPLCYAF